MSSRNIAVTVGRWQLVTVGHMAMARAVLQEYDMLCIAVSDGSRLPDGNYYPGQFGAPPALEVYANERSAPYRNPFSVAERIAFWRAAITTASLEKNMWCAPTLRPDLFPDDFNTHFPAEIFDLVYGPSTDPRDEEKLVAMETILKRKVYSVRHDQIVHTTDVKKSVRSGGHWNDLIAPGADAIFERVSGPERISRAGL